jgi:hypothetical protein
MFRSLFNIIPGERSFLPRPSFFLYGCSLQVAAQRFICAVTSHGNVAGITHLSYSKMLKQMFNLNVASYNNIIDVYCGTIYLLLSLAKYVDHSFPPFLFLQASSVVCRQYDEKCRQLRHQESRGESQMSIDKTRAVVKDLHSRILVAIQRIDMISKNIEDLRDKELQPQLEELIGRYIYRCSSIQLAF